MSKVEKFQELQADIERLQKKANKLEGLLERDQIDLHELIGTNDLGKAEKVLKKKQAHVKKLKEKLKERFDEFEEQYGELLESHSQRSRKGRSPKRTR